MPENLSVLGLCGSLRKASLNGAVLRAAQQLAPAGMTIEIFDLAPVTLFNQDEEKAPPASVLELKRRIRAADGVLFVTPEYNYSVPGVLKNAIDWASRPGGDSAWAGKPAAILGASMGALGTARAQYHLRQILVSLKMPALLGPEIMVAAAHEKVDASGALTDAKTRELLAKQLEAFAGWIRRLQA